MLIVVDTVRRNLHSVSINMSESGESSDIEVVSVHYENRAAPPDSCRPSSPVSSLLEFVWKELTHGGQSVSSESLQLALDKYEVSSGPDQVQDMLQIAGTDGSITMGSLQNLLEGCGA